MSSFTRLRKKAVTCKCPVIETGCKWKGVSGPFGKGIAAAVAYGNGRWVTFGSDFENGKPVGKIYYSDDGVTWTLADSPPDFSSGGEDSICGVAYGNRWVVVGGNRSGTGKKIYYSEDGITWFPASGEPFGKGFGVGVAYDKKSRWVAVGKGSVQNRDTYTGKNIWYSDNGIDWNPAPGEPFGRGISLDNGTGYGVAYDGKRWVAAGSGSSVSKEKNIYYSDDGINWRPVPGEPFGINTGEGGYGGGRVAYGNRWVAVGYGIGSALGKNIYYSEDGINWTVANGKGLSEFFGPSVAYGNRWVAVGVGSSIGSSAIYYSDDGISWTPEFATGAANECLPLIPFAVAYGNRWVVVGIGNNATGITGTNIYYE